MRPALVVCWLSCLFLLASPAASQIGELPNFDRIAVIVLDDVGVDMLSCYGEGADTPNTPHICGLAQEGVLFRNAWANPTCSPTRATVQTGRYGFRNGVSGPGVVLPDAEVTIPEVLADPINEHLGFNTAAIGKWHLSGGNFSNPPNCFLLADPRDQGYGRGAGTASNFNNYFN